MVQPAYQRTKLLGLSNILILKIKPTYLLMALGGAILCAIATELINWFLIYRHEDYKELTKEIVDSTDKLLN